MDWTETYFWDNLIIMCAVVIWVIVSVIIFKKDKKVGDQ